MHCGMSSNKDQPQRVCALRGWCYVKSRSTSTRRMHSLVAPLLIGSDTSRTCENRKHYEAHADTSATIQCTTRTVTSICSSVHTITTMQTHM
jgi:hypothetical protein